MVRKHTVDASSTPTLKERSVIWIRNLAVDKGIWDVTVRFDGRTCQECRFVIGLVLGGNMSCFGEDTIASFPPYCIIDYFQYLPLH